MAEFPRIFVDCFRGRRALNVLVLAGVLGLGFGCSAVPDYANPVEWYKGTVDWISGDDEDEVQPATTSPQPVAKADAPAKFPKLNTVPDRPQPPSEAQKKNLTSGLAADRAAARYTDEQVRAGKDVSVSSSGRANSPGSVTPEVVNTPLTPVPPPERVVARAPIAAQPPAARPEQRGFGSPPAAPARSDFQASAPRPAAVAPVSSMAAATPPNMVPASRDGSVFVQADRFSPRFPANSRQIARVQSGALARSDVQAPAVGGSPVATVYFGNGSSQLNNRAKSRIRSAVALYKHSRRSGIQVVGHASSRTRNLDPSRHHLANFRASHARANAVARELIRLGIPSSDISISAVADQQPAFVEVMPAGESGNRRAEIIFVR